MSATTITESLVKLVPVIVVTSAVPKTPAAGLRPVMVGAEVVPVVTVKVTSVPAELLALLSVTMRTPAAAVEAIASEAVIWVGDTSC